MLCVTKTLKTDSLSAKVKSLKLAVGTGASLEILDY